MAPKYNNVGLAKQYRLCLVIQSPILRDSMGMVDQRDCFHAAEIRARIATIKLVPDAPLG